MTIAWIYLDKKSAAVEALKDYASMEYIINHHAERLEDVEEDMVSVQSASITELSKQRNPHAGETWIAYSLDEIDVLKERYRQALEYMEWFRPAWVQLDEDERFILTEFFLREDISKAEAIGNVGEKLLIERTHVYRRKDKSLNHLALLLYGK